MQGFRITVLSTLAPRKAYATTGVPPIRGFFADHGKIDTLLAAIPVGVKLEVSDPFGPAGARMRVDLRIAGLKSFRPEVLVQEVPVLRALAAVPARLTELAQRGAGREAVVEELARLLPSRAWAEAIAPDGSPGPTPAQVQAQKASTIDSLLDQVDVSPEQTPSAFSSLISQVARGGSPSRSRTPAVGRERASRALSTILGDIFDHPEFRRLERVWRSARYLLGEATAPVEVEFVPIDDQNLAEALTHLVDRPAEVVQPPDLIVLDVDVPLTDAGLAALEVPALVAERLRAPLVVSTRVDELIENEGATQALRKAGAAAWAPWIVIGCNGALVRGPHATPLFKQDASSAGAHCFVSGPYLLAALAARAYKHDGWASNVSGPEAGHLGGFEVHGVMVGAETSAFASEKLVSAEAARKNARRGLFTVTAVPNRDTVVSVGVPTLASAASANAPTFSDQMFVARIAGVVSGLGASIPPGTDPAAAQEVAAILLADLFPRHGGSLPTFSATVRDDTLSVTVAPRRFAGTSLGEITLEAPLGGEAESE